MGGNASKVLWAIVYIGLIGSIGIAVLRHADQFKTAFGSLSSFFLSEMRLLQG